MAQESPQIPQESYDYDSVSATRKIPETKYFYMFGERIDPIYGVPKKKTGIRTGISFDDISLESEETSMPLTDGSISPTTIRLFGQTIIVSPQESSSWSSKETSSDGSRKRSRTSMIQETTDEDAVNNHSSEAESSKKPKLTCSPRNNHPWTIMKTLTASDIGTNRRLTVDTKNAKKHIMNHLSEEAQNTIEEGIGFKVKVYDEENHTEYELTLMRHKSSKSFVLNGGWGQDFIKRRKLEEGDEIGLFWNVGASRLHFRVLVKVPPAN